MPIYQYKCEECDEVRDVVRSMDHMDDEYTCPNCGGNCVRIQTVPGRFKRGSGWAARVDTPMPGKV